MKQSSHSSRPVRSGMPPQVGVLADATAAVFFILALKTESP
jgi:hypothetical protein